MAVSEEDTPVVWPSIRCGDTRTLIDFLVAAFGFEEQFTVPRGGRQRHHPRADPVAGRRWGDARRCREG
jgi:uncharacterized glyoxalase superfamily protein PhnB